MQNIPYVKISFCCLSNLRSVHILTNLHSEHLPLIMYLNTEYARYIFYFILSSFPMHKWLKPSCDVLEDCTHLSFFMQWYNFLDCVTLDWWYCQRFIKYILSREYNYTSQSSNRSFIEHINIYTVGGLMHIYSLSIDQIYLCQYWLRSKKK